MKSIIILFLLVAWFVVAITFSNRGFGADWSTRDTVLQAVVLATFELDRQQTLEIKNHPELRERNPILGSHPNDADINGYFISAAIIHTLIAYALPARLRTAFQASTIVLEVVVINGNYSVGLRGSL